MKNIFYLFLFLFPGQWLFAQAPASQVKTENIAPLTVKKIMRDPKWIGTSPSRVFWSIDSKRIYFNWNPTKATSDSLYFITLKNHSPQKVGPQQRSIIRAKRRGSWNTARTKMVYMRNHTLYIWNADSEKETALIQTTQRIARPHFGLMGKAVIYRQGNNLYAKNIETGSLTQLTNFKKESKSHKRLTHESAQEKFLEQDALDNSIVLSQRKAKREEAEQNRPERKNLIQPVYLPKGRLSGMSLSPDGKIIAYTMVQRPKVERTIVPNYVTQSGYTQDIPGRPVVGVKQPRFTSYLYNREADTVYPIVIADIPGIRDIPNFYKDYPDEYEAKKKADALRSVYVSQPIWNTEGTRAFVVVRSQDHKDRWIMALNTSNGHLQLLDRQHDEAWIGGPGMGYSYSAGNVGWINDHTIWYQSEKTGYSHLYTMNVKTGKKRVLTHGKYEVFAAELSPDHKKFYLTTNKVAPGQRQFYQLAINSGKLTRITAKTGGNRATVSPDGKQLAILFSTPNHPWELFLQDNKKGAEMQQITHKAESTEFKSYPWRSPKIFTYTDRDGLAVYAKVFEPENPAPSHPGVIFVHGAGYLQDVVQYWSDPYFREHMFMNFLVDQGYTVMEMDYRGSKGYGRDWRTAIYRHMGGNDLEDVVDGANYLVEHYGVNPANIGVWGGSYGGFMTLMVMFNTDTFAAGGALRSVTDWAHYNHGYTSNILNLPQNDPKAYKQSSPIYFAKGLQGALLMCHGMVDTNVHFQDIVRLSQRLIELEKKNWELAVYPVESHGFVEPSSWTDEYSRIYKLFEDNLK